MKETLKPIHFVQYNRIKIQENLEKFLVLRFSQEDSYKEAEELLGPTSTDVSLEDQVDLDNIHSWLESHLIASEKRTALLLKRIEKTEDEDALMSAYGEYGRKVGENAADLDPLSTGEPLYGYVSSILLDGMPCDKVNSLVASDEDTVEWHGQTDVHGLHFEEQDLEPRLFYALRKAFLDGVLSTKGNYTYEVEIIEDKIINRISKEV